MEDDDDAPLRGALMNYPVRKRAGEDFVMYYIVLPLLSQ
jgi:hypothetical protein